MIRSMYAAVTGLRTHQTMMDVIGNNIANVNTHGFKKSRTMFKEVLAETVAGARMPTEGVGGTNPASIGLGVKTASITQVMEQGAIQTTGRNLDVAIDGDGYFVVDFNGQQQYTRAGAFYLDAGGRLVTADSGLVQGWQADASGVINNATPTTDLTIAIGSEVPPVPTTQVQLAGNLPATSEIGDQVILGVEIFDRQGVPVPVTMTLEKTARNEWAVSGVWGDAQAPIGFTDTTLVFDDNGDVVTPADFSLDIPADDIFNCEAVKIMVGGPTVSTEFSQYGDLRSAAISTQNGASTGSLTDVVVVPGGVIMGTYSNGLSLALGQIATANFANPDGLTKTSGSNWRVSANSGLAQIGVPGSAGRGDTAPSALEMSNVDLGEEFTEMIRAQRGFQANSRMITTSDEILQELVNMKR